TDGLAEPVTEQWCQHHVHRVVSVVNPGIAAADHASLVAEELPEDSGGKSRRISDRNARAESAVEGVKGIFRVPAHAADGLISQNRVIDLSVKRIALLIVNIRLETNRLSSVVGQEVLNAVQLVGRHLHPPLEAEVEGQVGPDLEGVADEQAVGVRNRMVLKVRHTSQVEIATATHEDW